MKLYDREELKLAMEFIRNLNSYSIVGQQYLDVSYYADIVAKAFWEQKVLFYPQPKPDEKIRKLKANVQSADAYVYLLEEDMGFTCIGIEVGPYKTYIKRYRKYFNKV